MRLDAHEEEAPGKGKTISSIERNGGVQSLLRALSLLDALAENDDGQSLSALAKTVCLPPSSAHRLLTTLQRKHFVRFDPAAMTWRVGVRAFVVGNAFARSRELAPIAMPFMRQLMERTGETVNLYVPNGGHAICIAQVQSRQVIRAISRPGGSLPLHRSAAGKAILARMSEFEVDELLAKHTPSEAERMSARHRRKLHSELREVRSRGYSVDDEEVASGLRCIATSIADENGSAPGAVSIAGPVMRLTNQRLPGLAESVLAAGEAMTREFGGARRTGS
ncbi:MAG TPA: IclR family transcriptional regulator [Roseiarcus sp.]|nr:IclR family transcriptional regulator [Roseiarcus sp.]